jgi:type I restriction enzyme S subunit
MNRRLAELADIFQGKDYKANPPGEAIPIWGTGGIIGGTSFALNHGPAILTGRKGSIGSTFYVEGPFWNVDTIYCIKPRSGIHAKWLYYGLRSKDLTRLNEATGVPSVSTKALNSLSFNYVTYPDQCRIAAILDMVDEAIRQTEAVIEKLKRIKQGLLHDLLTRGIDKDGKLRPTPKQAPHLYKDSPLGKIPKDWEIRRVKEYAEVRGGKRLPFGHSYSPQPTSYQYLRVVDFFEREIAFSALLNLERKTYNALRRYEIRPGDIFISIAGSLGFSGVFRPIPGTSVILTENAARICLHVKNLLPDYLVYQLNGLQVQKQINKEKGVGGGVPKLALFRIESLQIAVPPVAEQEGIISRTNLIENHIRSEKYAREKLASLKQGLMEDLLSGRVRVNALPKNVVDMLDAIPGWN